MKITPIYKNQLITLPAETVLPKLSTASKEELAVLIATIAEPCFNIEKMCEKLDMTENAFRRALDSWIRSGTIFSGDSDVSSELSEHDDREDEIGDKKPDKSQRKNIVVHSEIPNYTRDEVTSIIESHAECSELIDSCHQILGKVLNAHEIAIIIGLYDHLRLSSEYIMLLCTHAAHVQKKSVRYVEQLAVGFYDNNITTYDALEEELKNIEKRLDLEKYIRGLFGMGKRALIAKEKEYIKNWNDKFRYGTDIIEAAYEITVSRTGEPNIKYTNAILENWFQAGLSTIDDVRQAEEERAKKRDSAPQSSSFSTDDFYEAALLRSYEQDKDKNGGK